MNIRSREPSRQAGFTLVELLIVAVLGSLILLATYEVLLTNQRTYVAQQAQIQSQQSVRSGTDVLFGELREISPRAGDLKIMASDSMKVRVMRKFGIACQVDPSVMLIVFAGTPSVRVYSAGTPFEDGDSAVIFADVDTTKVEDDTYIYGQINAGDTTQTCGSKRAQTLTFPGLGQAFTDSAVWAGAPVRSYVWYTYGLYQVDGDWYLGRHEVGGSVTPLLGPLASRSDGGLSFDYLDEDGSSTATADDVRQIAVTIRTPGEVRGPDGDLISDSLTTRIYTRN